METETQVITIVLETSIDQSQLLEMLVGMMHQLKDDIEDLDEEVIFDENEVSIICD
jgi:hypothetical protein